MPFSATSGSLVRRTGQGVFLLCALTRDRCSLSQDFLIVYFWYSFNIFHIFITSSVVSFSRTYSFSHLPFFPPVRRRFVALAIVVPQSVFRRVFFHIVLCFIVGKAHATSLYVSLARWSSGSSYQGRFLPQHAAPTFRLVLSRRLHTRFPDLPPSLSAAVRCFFFFETPAAPRACVGRRLGATRLRARLLAIPPFCELLRTTFLLGRHSVATPRHWVVQAGFCSPLRALR